ncbi:MAG: hypothetical protein ACP5D2_00385 [Candidatus Nanoarchaeia archaeon]
MAKSKGRDIMKKLSNNYWLVATAILAILLIIVLLTGSCGGVGKQEAGQKVLDFIEARGGEASLVEVNDNGNMYEVVLEMQGQEAPVYITKDGKSLIPVQAVIPLTGQVVQEPAQEDEIPKSDKPEVELYVMSFCPYGNEAEDTLLPVYNILKDYIDFNVHYIVSVQGDSINSLHGQPEVEQNMREVCVLDNYGMDKWFTFTTYVNENCGSSGDCWEEAANEAGVSTGTISDCVDEQGFELMEEEAAASQEAGASGSPTMLINGVKTKAVYKYGNPSAYQEAICSAFNEMPDACSEALSSTDSTTPAGQC